MPFLFLTITTEVPRRVAATALRGEALRVLDSYGAGAGHVFNLGHGITPDVDPERVALLVETVRNYKVSPA